MLRVVITLYICLLSGLLATATQPYCLVRTYDESDGLSQHLVKQVVQDDNGMIWVGTWNGLNRWDGYEFRTIRPDIDSEARRYSSRFSDLKVAADGKLWCRVDGRLITFDVNTYEFADLHSLIEQKLDRRIKIENISVTTDDDMVLTTDTDDHIFIPSSSLGSTDLIISTLTMSSEKPDKQLRTPANRRLGDVGPYRNADLTFSRKDDSGTVWLITRDGDIIHAPGEQGPFTVAERMGLKGQGLRFCTDDDQGNIWLCSKLGLHKITLGTAPYSIVDPTPLPSMLRTSTVDSKGRVWMSWSDVEMLSISPHESLGSPLWLGKDGRLSVSPVSFGAGVYSITPTPSGSLWLGTKPGALYRLTPLDPQASAYKVELFNPDPQAKGYYDGLVDSAGRLWLASMGAGIVLVEHPDSDSPTFLSLTEMEGYPHEGRQARRVLAIGDSLMVATTTGGLLSFPLPAPNTTAIKDFRLHASEPGNPTSLGNIATMDVNVTPTGQLFVATESDGVNALTSPLSLSPTSPWEFRKCQSGDNALNDVSISLSSFPDDNILVTGNNDAYLINTADGEVKTFGQSYWHARLHFSEARPMLLADGLWLLGLNDGAVTTRLDPAGLSTERFPIEFTSVAIAGKEDRALTHDADSLALRPDERAVMLSFSALCYSDPSSIRYAYHTDRDREWTALGHSRTISFTNLSPGTYHITVRSTDTHGRWLDNDSTFTLEVLPAFWETGWAKTLYVIITLLIIGAVVWTAVYIRRIKRLQRETLEAHLRLLESRAALNDAPTSTQSQDASAPPAPLSSQPMPEAEGPHLSPDDKAMMDSLMDYIEVHFADSSISVDDMAAAVAVSRSGLTRKMKSLMGVTPADFLRATRLSRAATLLATTSSPIKEIAMDCGFADMNYFGKCFKASHGETPGAYRKSHAISE